VKARPVKKLNPGAPLGENAARIVKVRTDELLSFAPRALEPDRVKAQHDMRIAAKRLRYVLELTGFCFGKPADVARRRARDLQDILGEMHDCDVMLPRVRAQVEALQAADAAAVRSRAGETPDLDPRLAARAPNRTAYRGLDVLSVFLRARRELLFDRFVAFWREQEEKGTWAGLDRAADAQLERARQARRARKAAEKAEREAAEAERAHREAAERAERARAEREDAAQKLERREPKRPAAKEPGGSRPVGSRGRSTSSRPASRSGSRRRAG